MCAVSMVTDHYMRKWPYPTTWPNWPQESYEEYLELKRKAAEYDLLTNQPDCPAPDKVEWQLQVDEYMKQHYGLEPKE